MEKLVKTFFDGLFTTLPQHRFEESVGEFANNHPLVLGNELAQGLAAQLGKLIRRFADHRILCLACALLKDGLNTARYDFHQNACNCGGGDRRDKRAQARRVNRVFFRHPSFKSVFLPRFKCLAIDCPTRAHRLKRHVARKCRVIAKRGQEAPCGTLRQLGASLVSHPVENGTLVGSGKRTVGDTAQCFLGQTFLLVVNESTCSPLREGLSPGRCNAPRETHSSGTGGGNSGTTYQKRNLFRKLAQRPAGSVKFAR